jgi:hypothetical protein
LYTIKQVLCSQHNEIAKKVIEAKMNMTFIRCIHKQTELAVQVRCSDIIIAKQCILHSHIMTMDDCVIFYVFGDERHQNKEEKITLLFNPHGIQQVASKADNRRSNGPRKKTR